VHLGDAEVVGDLALAEVAVEPQHQQPPLPVGQVAQQPLHGGPVVDEAQTGVGAAEEVAHLRSPGAVHGHVERGGVIGGRRRPRVAHGGLVDVEIVGQFPGVRGAGEAGGQHRARLPELEGEVLHPAGHVHVPRVVAEVALELAGDGDHGVRGERAPLGVVPIHGLHEAEPGHLLEVLDALAPAAVAAGQPPGDRQRVPDEIVAQPAPRGAVRAGPGTGVFVRDSV